MREFISSQEAIKYAEDKWKPFFDGLNPSFKNKILSIQASGRRNNDFMDKKIIEALYAAVEIIPAFDEDVILYRGGKEEDFDGNRPFLSASFLKTTAEKFAQDGNIYRIHVHKGARAIPDCGMGMLGCGPEEEVVLETKKIHRNGFECDYYENTGFYKFYQLINGKLYSHFGDGSPINMGEISVATHSSQLICFAKIDNILDYYDQFGNVICDILPQDEIINSLESCSKVESMCNKVIAVNPRSVFSPSFIEEIITNTHNRMTWNLISSETFLLNALDHFKDGNCYNINLNFNLEETLYHLLIDDFSNNRAIYDEYFSDRRKKYDYAKIYVRAKRNGARRNAKKIIVEAWNKNAPSKRSKWLRVLY